MALVFLRIDTIGHTTSSQDMSNNARSPMSRRGLLRLGLFASACGVAGCGEPEAKKIDDPGAPTGGRKRLSTIEAKTEKAPTKKP
jgi:hypothetical protein